MAAMLIWRLKTCTGLPLLGPSVAFSYATKLNCLGVTRTMRGCGLNRRSYLMTLSANTTVAFLPGDRTRHSHARRGQKKSDYSCPGALLSYWMSTRTHESAQLRVVEVANVIADVVPAQTEPLTLLLAVHDVLG